MLPTWTVDKSEIEPGMISETGDPAKCTVLCESEYTASLTSMGETLSNFR